MDPSKLHKITNSFQNVRLISLSRLKVAAEFPERDHAGPYLVAQEGYDPGDLTVTPTEFLLGKSGAWLATHFFLHLPVEQRRAEFFFSTAAQVMELMQDLPAEAVIAQPGHEATEPPPSAETDELRQTLLAVRNP